MDTLQDRGYDVYETPRTNNREDGLLTAVDTARWEVIGKESVHFNDCGDRVAQVLHLADRDDGAGSVLLVNTHLLFPHNSNSTLIRLREVYKLMEFLDDYRRYRTGGACRSLPILLAGDFNGTTGGQVFDFLVNQGFVSAFHEAHAGEPCLASWVSHRSHRQELVGVDFVWLLQPSKQATALTADWRRPIFAMITAKLQEQGCNTNQAAFRYFADGRDGDVDKECSLVVSADRFRDALSRLGLTGPGSVGLVPDEILHLLHVLDADGDGVVDYFEFCSAIMDADSMCDAYAKVRAATGIWEGPWQFDQGAAHSATYRHDRASLDEVSPLLEGEDSYWGEPIDPDSIPRDLEIVGASLVEDAFASGVWPEDFTVSDHAPLTACFR